MQFIDLQKQYQAYKNDIDKQIHSVLDSSHYVLGEKVSELEATLAQYVGTKYALGVSSGTDALLMALMAKDVRPGDEIITTPFTFFATAEVISFLGATPVFVDIKEDTYNIDPARIEAKITSKTKGIIAVDIFGQMADYDAINAIAEKHGIFVIEDAAQSFGAKYKEKRSCSIAEIACTSFFPAKPLGGYGDGGMIFLNDDKILEKLRSIRVHGQGEDKYNNVRIGINGRLDAIQAAILIGKMPYFNGEMEKRQKVAEFYNKNLKDILVTPKVLERNISAYAQYCVRSNQREKHLLALKKNSIPYAIYYPKPLHLMTAFESLNYMQGDFPITEKIAGEIFALPMHPFLEEKDQKTIVDILTDK
ncbi:MAG: DegT/DnrJ/EryC1/StrS family aminotransferase [Candidatus Aureabacteria bacterium]|nr:DegT/DnrJ/EryC1/StrS family aminotransferase [Candidatus Auribacterota bacterium]